MRRYEGRVALITGAAAGIGRATAERLASEGASLFLTDVAREGLAREYVAHELVVTRTVVAPDAELPGR